jgi:hypothetical protein
MATPHVSAALALAASARADLRGHPGRLLRYLKGTARDARNTTRVLDPNDHSGGDLTGGQCPTGYCHLGGATISDRAAYGAGIVQVPQP